MQICARKDRLTPSMLYSPHSITIRNVIEEKQTKWLMNDDDDDADQLLSLC